MAKNLTRLQKSTNILSNSKITKWKYVDANNEFVFMEKVFVIDDSVEEYKVYQKAGVVEDFTNEAYMDEILIAIDNDNNLRFYNQNYDEIDSTLVKIKSWEVKSIEVIRTNTWSVEGWAC